MNPSSVLPDYTVAQYESYGAKETRRCSKKTICSRLGTRLRLPLSIVVYIIFAISAVLIIIESCVNIRKSAYSGSLMRNTPIALAFIGSSNSCLSILCSSFSSFVISLFTFLDMVTTYVISTGTYSFDQWLERVALATVGMIPVALPLAVFFADDYDVLPYLSNLVIVLQSMGYFCVVLKILCRAFPALLSPLCSMTISILFCLSSIVKVMSFGDAFLSVLNIITIISTTLLSALAFCQFGSLFVGVYLYSQDCDKMKSDEIYFLGNTPYNCDCLPTYVSPPVSPLCIMLF